MVFCDSFKDDHFLMNVVREREDELTRRTLQSLNDMRIKFPGKSDHEADMILDKVLISDLILRSAGKFTHNLLCDMTYCEILIFLGQWICS